MAELILERARQTDFPLVVDILMEGFRDDPELEYFRREFLQNPERHNIYLIKLNGTIVVGSVGLTGTDDMGVFVSNFTILKRHRRKGYARRLVEQFLSEHENKVYLELDRDELRWTLYRGCTVVTR